LYVFLEKTALLLLLYVVEAMMWSLHTIENCKIASEEHIAAVGFLLKREQPGLPGITRTRTSLKYMVTVIFLELLIERFHCTILLNVSPIR
jgi:hypothetical protein